MTPRERELMLRRRRLLSKIDGPSPDEVRETYREALALRRAWLRDALLQDVSISRWAPQDVLDDMAA